MINRKCPYCGSPFSTSRVDKRFCCLACTYRYHQLKNRSINELCKLSLHDRRVYKKIKHLQ
ncbi:MAG TPA: hypothetical protein PLT65_04285 [Bacilli bacterium]|nr:hypothetical protein [Bacilli bacterium]